MNVCDCFCLRPCNKYAIRGISCRNTLHMLFFAACSIETLSALCRGSLCCPSSATLLRLSPAIQPSWRVIPVLVHFFNLESLLGTLFRISPACRSSQLVMDRVFSVPCRKHVFVSIGRHAALPNWVIFIATPCVRSLYTFQGAGFATCAYSERSSSACVANSISSLD